MDVRQKATAPHQAFFPPPRPPRGPSRWVSLVVQEYRELAWFWPVIQNMVRQDLRVRYHRSMLGFFWTLLHPILMMTTMALVFSQLFGMTAEGLAVYMFAGMVPWSFLAGSLNDCSICIIANESLIKKIYIPKLVFPLARTLSNLTTFVLSLGALFVLLKPLGAKISPSLLALPLVIALFFAFVLGMGLFLATANTFFRDCGHLVSVILQAWYFATPIIYETNRMSEHVRWRFWLNPAYPFIRMFQEIIRDGQWPLLSTFLVAAGIAAVSLGIGYATFKSHENKMVFRL